MKKKILLAVTAFALCFSATTLNAQAFDEGKSVVTIGYGFPNLVTGTFRTAYNTADHTGYTFNAMGPLIFRYEYGLSEKIGMGVVFGYSMMKLSYTYEDWNSTYTAKTNYTASIKWNSPSAGLRMNIHFATKDKLDPYFGVSAGWSGNSLTYEDNNPNNTTNKTSINFGPFYFGLGVGMRYYFTDNIGMYVEFGWDKWALMQGGLAAKF
jgi:hypothetical protein